MSAVSKGVWIDSASGRVVEQEPSEGTQLVAPGCEVTPDVQARIDAARNAEVPVEKAVAKRSEKRG